METYQRIENSIITKYRKEIWGKFVKAVKTYELIKENDKIAVCISGGKDSFLLAKCMQELKKHGKISFELEFIVMDPGYHQKNKEKIIENAKLLNIPIQIFSSNVFAAATSMSERPCYMCARMRRGFLYDKAKELGCNKIALGHHFDDVVETILMGLLYGAQIQTMMPKLHSTNFEGMELIRPLYLVKEKDILSFCKYHDLTFLNCACPLTEKKEQVDSKRTEIKKLIADYKKTNPNIDIHIFRSVENINLKTILGYHDEEKFVSFLDHYDDKNLTK